jgi:hypothetical protein
VEAKDSFGNIVDISAKNNHGNDVGMIVLKGPPAVKSMILEYIPHGLSNTPSNHSAGEVTALTGREWAVLLKYLIQKSSD